MSVGSDWLEFGWDIIVAVRPWLFGWSVGLIFALGVGGFFVWLFLKVLRSDLKLPDDNPDLKTRQVPPWLTGLVERFFFTIAVALVMKALPVIITAMVTWLAVKMLANWNRPREETPELTARRARGAIAALLGGLLSMLFALVGGLLSQATFPS
jgi:hypothetical protein